MKMRLATPGDGALIARLHTASWRSAYHAILDPGFLAGPIEEDRLSAWMSRIAQQNPHELILIAEAADEPIGFVCAVGAEHDQWGTLIDNLHLLPTAKGRGLGATLLKVAAEWSTRNYRTSGIYLWCYEQNEPARRFYERLGGVVVERGLHDAPGGGVRPALRLHWPDPASAFSLVEVR
jgi:GNAT superfamily N-acetyltransferase